ncbi:hypothetical protein MLD38_025721 [Melastoma candidum]|uniref:Uncharacterized protein n=1 Tax=Melastoma candidum TaxID=119954 RepID=A0ACB9NWB5_9MYRT|nr:hypothetical protein MLD38_025721 [Melastoma candidum]
MSVGWLSSALSSSFVDQRRFRRRRLAGTVGGCGAGGNWSEEFYCPAKCRAFTRVLRSRGSEGAGLVLPCTKKNDLLQYKLVRVPFLEEKVRKIKETGKLLTMDFERLLLSEENRFDFINEIAAEAIEYVENNKDEYGGTKKAILHALSNKVNDMGFAQPEAYAEPDPYKPRPGYLKQEFT